MPITIKRIIKRIDDVNFSSTAFLSLMQLTNASLPVGAYSYSEGIETRVETGAIATVTDLHHWLDQELQYGGIQTEAAIVVRAYRAVQADQPSQLADWNHWLSAARETEELRQQSWQMGRALARLLPQLNADTESWLEAVGTPCNFAIAFAIAAAVQPIPLEMTIRGYLHSWASNLINAGIRLVPLGQTEGQILLHNLHPVIEQTVTTVMALEDADLSSGGWGLSLASMQHETLYSRLFRS